MVTIFLAKEVALVTQEVYVCLYVCTAVYCTLVHFLLDQNPEPNYLNHQHECCTVMYVECTQGGLVG